MDPLPRKMLLLVATTALVMICCGAGSIHAYEGPYAAFSWTPAHATFYGGEDAEGTMGGACGFGNLYSSGYGTLTAALSTTLFNHGFSCGACFEIMCDFTSTGYSTKWCHANAQSITVTATNLCPPNYERITNGWCNPPRTHFDLAFPAFSQLADGVAGIIPIQYRRVGCAKTGGLRFKLGGNRWFSLVLIYNVGGAGNVIQMAMKGSGSPVWYPMIRNWGQFWEGHHELLGESLCFRVTLSTGQTLVVDDLTGPNWQFGETYESSLNFGSNLI